MKRLRAGLLVCVCFPLLLAAADFKVPAFSLQPFVENALKRPEKYVARTRAHQAGHSMGVRRVDFDSARPACSRASSGNMLPAKIFAAS